MSQNFETKFTSNQAESEPTTHRDKLGEVALTGSQHEGDNQPAEYEILELDGDPDLSRAMRRNYLRNTFRLTEKIQESTPDYVLYLDKSARPVAWLENDLFEDFVYDPDNEHEPVKKPETIFLNIDREHWREQTGGKEFGSGQVDVKDIDAGVIDSLRSIFLRKEPDAQKSPSEQESLLDGRKILIVDEVRFTGDTLKIAQELIKAAFPDATLDTHHWMTSPKSADPRAKSTGLPDVPVWYKQNAEWGRGVANRNFASSRQSESWRQRTGAIFLSTRFPKPDKNSLKLRSELAQLADEYREGVYGSVVY